MATTSTVQPIISAKRSRSVWQRLATFLYLRPKLVLALLLGPPLLAYGVFYLGSLAALLVQSFFHLDDFTGRVVH